MVKFLLVGVIVAIAAAAATPAKALSSDTALRAAFCIGMVMEAMRNKPNPHPQLPALLKRYQRVVVLPLFNASTDQMVEMALANKSGRDAFAGNQMAAANTCANPSWLPY